MSRAVADTNTLIHLYRSDTTHLMFDLFDGIDYYEFEENIETKRHGRDIIPKIDHDIINGKVRRITKEYLTDTKLWSLFQLKVNFMKDLFMPADKGEQYAIALAQTTGSSVILTDDTKDDGPYHTVNRGLCEDVDVALAFWDLLYLNMLTGNIDTLEDTQAVYDHIGKTGYNPPFLAPFKSKMNGCVRRFERNGPKWYKQWCTTFNVTSSTRGSVVAEVMKLKYQ